MLSSFIGGVLGPNSSIDGHIATFDGTTGKIIQQQGAAIVQSTSSVGLAELVLRDHLGNNVLVVEHSDNFDNNSIVTSRPFSIFSNTATNDINLLTTGGDIDLTAGGTGEVILASSKSAVGPGIEMAQLGPNGGSAKFAITSLSTPNGVVDAGLDTTAISQTTGLYKKTTASGSTGWERYLTEADVGVTMSNTPVDNAMIVADGVSGDTVKADNSITSETSGSNAFLNLEAPGASGNVQIELDANGGSSKAFWNYLGASDLVNFGTNNSANMLVDSAGTLTIEADAALFIGNSTGATEVKMGSTGGEHTIAATTGIHTFSTNSAASSPGFLFSQLGTNGDTVSLTPTSINPNGLTRADGGSIVLKSDGTNSDIYLKIIDGGNTGWIPLYQTFLATAFEITNTPVDNALLTADGTSGTEAQAVNNAFFWQS